MNLQKIYDGYPPHDPGADYLAEVARRIKGLLKDRAIDVRLSMALIHLLALNEIRFSDGFVVNDMRVFEHTMGYVEACMVVAALCEAPDQSVEWWNGERLIYDYMDESYNTFFDDLVAQIKGACPGLEMPYHRSRTKAPSRRGSS